LINLGRIDIVTILSINQFQIVSLGFIFKKYLTPIFEENMITIAYQFFHKIEKKGDSIMLYCYPRNTVYLCIYLGLITFPQ
jgi:hypothetical protein